MELWQQLLKMESGVSNAKRKKKEICKT